MRDSTVSYSRLYLHACHVYDIVLFQVIRSARCGLKHKGQSCISLRLCSLASPLQIDESEISDAIKSSQCGRTNVNKDFLSPAFSDSYVKRGKNHTSQRCAIIYTSSIHPSLMEKLNGGN